MAALSHDNSSGGVEAPGSLDARLSALARVADSNDSPGPGPFTEAGKVARELRAWIQRDGSGRRAGSPVVLEAVRELVSVACSLHHDSLGIWRLSQAALRVQCVLSQRMHPGHADDQEASIPATDTFISRFTASFQEELGALEAGGGDVSPDVLRDTVASWV